MIDTIIRGGFMMIPILLGSVLALTIIIERFLVMQRSRVLPEAFLERMNKMLKTGKVAEAISACRENDSVVARIMSAGLENSHRSKSDIKEALEDAGKLEATNLSRWIAALGRIEAMEPLMGLLGTVLGMIEAFKKIEELNVIGDPSALASGVWQALITTAAGLLIAIPTFVFYRYFRTRINSLLLEMEQNAHLLLRHMSEVAPVKNGETN